MNLRTCFFMTLAAVAAVSPAQRPGRPPQAPGGPGGPGGVQRIEMRMDDGMNPGYLRIPAVQKELHLSGAQIAKINAAMPQPRASQTGTPEVFRKRMQDRMAKMKAMVKSLSPAQKQRLKELTLQGIGAQALMAPKVQRQLGLTPDQVKRIQAVRTRVDGERQAAMQKLGIMNPTQPQDQNAWRQRMDQIRANSEKWRREMAVAVDHILTGPQKAKWHAMQGRPFDVSQLRMRRGPGGPGGFGGPGGRWPGGGGGRRGGNTPAYAPVGMTFTTS